MGKIIRVAGPVVDVHERGLRMFEVVRVGKEKLTGEVVKINGPVASVQVYEDTSGIKPGDPAEGTGRLLSVELGPGLIGTIYDGIQRPLPELAKKEGDFIRRGTYAPPLDPKRKWKFIAKAKKGQKVEPGDLLGVVNEGAITHKIMVPPGVKGKLTDITEGALTVDDVIAHVGKTPIKMKQIWPIRKPRPHLGKIPSSVPLITGQRVLDFFFPIVKGGTAAIPGPFGSGKTVTQQQLAKWADADVIVYIGCGERGNEMTEVLTEFPELKDPKTGKPLMDRTVLIANTSNMPVAAREASVYTGITIAEYYRDMGYNVALMADSTSRWAEAMREISSRLEEMPAEEGYPPYLGMRLAEFYERAGKVKTKQGEGSVSIIGAVSPPGGDFLEPVTQNTLKVVKAFWALDASLASRRHYPSINWLLSYSLYLESVKDWYSKKGDWYNLREWAMDILQREEELKEIVQLVGPEALPEREKFILEVARMIREDFLQQNAFHEVDTYCPVEKQISMMAVIKGFFDEGMKAIDRGVKVRQMMSTSVKRKIAQMKYMRSVDEVDALRIQIQKEMMGLEVSE